MPTYFFLELFLDAACFAIIPSLDKIFLTVGVGSAPLLNQFKVFSSSILTPSAPLSGS